MKPATALLTTALGVTAILSTGPGVRSEVSRGTLITVFDTDEGKLICADRRVWNRMSGATDNVTKIGMLRPDAIYATAGSSAISIVEDNKLVEKFSVQAVIEDFFKKSKAKRLSHHLIETFATQFSTDFVKASKLYGTNMESSPGSTDDVVTEIDFLYLDESSKEQMDVLKIHTNGISTVEPFAGHVYVSGETSVMLRIIRPQQYRDNRFADLWGDRKVAQVWLQGTSVFPQLPKLEDALYVSHFFIKATAERSQYLTQGPLLVGPTCDCGLLRPTGFEWLQRNFDTQKGK